MAEEFKTGLRTTKDDFANGYAAGKAAYQANSWRGWNFVAMALAFFAIALARQYRLPWYEALAAYVAVVVVSRIVIQRLRASSNGNS